ncbi:glycoside hydrolase family 19 protein [Pseudacidovorax intermedius]|uniref:glycoside hydrolase family 19 protein n=1 Tax=Pseudacidovorax intermedius TaxID=433924 RepID=UPI0026F36C42|nr:glycoside hydrolase family 19 protein [Pseudacidovorax intermedius]
MLSLSLIALCTGAPERRAERFAAWLISAMDAYAITTPLRQAAFLAQVGHESQGLLYTSELWGPTPAQRGYEGRVDLGNTHPGDGFKYRGHGLIQTTGRENHAAVRDRLRVRFGTRVPDFVVLPEKLCEPEWAAYSAADFWDMKKLNPLADAGAFFEITRRINGGRNGLEDRLRRYEVAKEALGVA